MKALRIAGGAMAIAGALALAGCSLTGLPGGTTPSPTPFAGFPVGSKLTGRYTFDGKAPPTTALSVQFNEVKDGVRQTKSTVTTTSDAGGYFSFKDVTAGSYQVIWDDGGQTVEAADVNTVGIYVSDPVTSPPTSLTAPQVTLELKWAPNPKPAPKDKVTKGTTSAFTFDTIPNLDAVYQISLFNSSKSAQTPTGTGSASPLNVDTFGLAAGEYLYQIKFWKTGGKFGGANFFGSTKYIPITLQ